MSGPVLRDARSFRPFKSSEEYLYAMKEDLAEWLSMLYPELDINVDNFLDRLDTGVALCKHANNVKVAAEEYVQRKQARKLSMSTSTTGSIALPIALLGDVHYLGSARPGTFFARDNVSNFINWCRRGLGVFECLLFETDDLILRKNEKHVILCLLDVARRGARLGMLAPMLVQLEREIDREIALEQGSQAHEDSDEEELGPAPQIVTNDLKSLDEMVRDLVERCQCPVQFPMIRVSEGKYRIGDTKVLIFVRVLRNHVMVRVGGGWDTLSHYLDKHDPCRCKTAHRSPLSAKLILKSGGSLELGSAHVHYERSPPRTRRSSASSISSGGGGGREMCNLTATPSTPSQARSRSPTPRRSVPSSGSTLHAPRPSSNYGGSTDHLGGRATPTLRGGTRSRSRSPTPTPVRPPSRRHSAVIDNNNAVVVGETTVTPASPVVITTDQHLNDSGSEVSDEGYRSLGTVIVSPAAQDKKSEVDGSKQDAGITERPEDCLTHHTSSSDSILSVSDDISKPADIAPLIVPEVKLQEPKQRTRTLPLPSPETHHRKLSQPPPSNLTRPVVTPMTRSRSTCGESGFHDSPPDSPRKNSAYRSVRNDPRAKPVATGTSGKQPQNNTWSGRQGKTKPRPALTDTTFSNSNNLGFGSRASLQRRSLGAYGSTHSTPSRTNNNTAKRVHKGSLPSSLQTSPTKQISPLLEEILQVKELDNDVTVLLKMKEIIQQYADIVDEKLVEERRHEAARGLPTGEDELDFTSAWVHSNGSLDGIQQTARRKNSCSSVSGDSVKVGPSPRKDSKPEGSITRIPVPVYFGTNDS